MGMAKIADSEDGFQSDTGSEDSDKELQVAFSQGLLKPGLNVVLPEKPKAINNVAGLEHSLQDLKSDLPWIERMDLTLDPIAAPKPMLDQLGSDPDQLTGDDVHDDFKREMKFYRQAQAAVLEGLPRLQSMSIPTRRPEDYFAQMAKSDDHMKKVREKLISKQMSVERSEKAKKLRELRKYGKKVQQEVLQKRQKEKKEMLDAVKKYRKGQQDKLDFLDDEDSTKKSDRNKQQNNTKKKQIFQPNKKRDNKNKKFGFGGQKKRSKYNTKASASDMSDFKSAKHTTRPGKVREPKQKKGAQMRPGKSKRQKMNVRRKR